MTGRYAPTPTELRRGVQQSWRNNVELLVAGKPRRQRLLPPLLHGVGAFYKKSLYNKGMDKKEIEAADSITASQNFDLIIIGGGAAGLAAAQYGARAGLMAAVIDGTGDEGGAGGQAGEIATLENYPGIFPAINGYDFIETMKKQAQYFGAVIIHDKALSLDKIKDVFAVHGGLGQVWKASAVIIATGAKKRRLGVPGEEVFFGRGVSYCATCDGPFFKNKRIIVAGGGDSALSSALHLASLSPFITIVHRRNEFRGNAFLQERVRKAGVSLKMGQVIKEITGKDKVQGVILSPSPAASSMASAALNPPESRIECDAVFICAGTMPRTEIADFLPKDNGGYIKTDIHNQTACRGLFAAGDVRSTPLRQVVTAAADGAVAAMAAAEYISLIEQTGASG